MNETMMQNRMESAAGEQDNQQEINVVHKGVYNVHGDRQRAYRRPWHIGELLRVDYFHSSSVLKTDVLACGDDPG